MHAIGLLGLGRIGKIHQRTINKHYECKLVAAFDPQDQENSSVASEQELYEKKLDGIIIATPSSEHRRQIVAALEKDIHVFCEKPLALTVSDHIAVQDAQSKSKARVQVGFNRRFDQDFSHVQNLVRQQEKHSIHLIKITSRDPAPPARDYLRKSGGLFFDMAIHDFDMIRFISQDEVSTVFARGARKITPAIEHDSDIDTATVMLRMRSGAMGLIDLSRRSGYGYDQRAEVFGSFGSIKNDHHRQSSVEHYQDVSTTIDNPLDFFLDRYQYAYEQEIDHFVSNLDKWRSDTPGIGDAIKALAIAEACNLSIDTDSAVSL